MTAGGEQQPRRAVARSSARVMEHVGKGTASGDGDRAEAPSAPALLTRRVGLWLYTPPDSERLLPATLMSQSPPERALRADVWYLKEIAFGEGEARKNYKIITQNYNGCVGVFV